MCFLSFRGRPGFRSVITTNGTLLDRCGETLIAAGLHKVNISVHSFEQGEDAAHEAYLQKLAAFAGAASRAGVLVSFRLWNNGFDEGRNEKTLALLRRFLPGPWQENTRGYRLRDRVFLEWGERFTWPDAQAPEGSCSLFCYGLRDHFGILSDGTVVPCCLDSDGVIDLGNVFTQPLEEILNSPRAKAILDGFSQRKAVESLCRRCGYAHRFDK